MAIRAITYGRQIEDAVTNILFERKAAPGSKILSTVSLLTSVLSISDGVGAYQFELRHTEGFDISQGVVTPCGSKYVLLAVHPEKTGWLLIFKDKNDRHIFSERTYEEHEIEAAAKDVVDHFMVHDEEQEH